MNRGVIKNTYKISYETVDNQVKTRYCVHKTSEEALAELESDPNVKMIINLRFIKSDIYYWWLIKQTFYK